ncbi:hypothetical protein [Bacillus cereus]|uniref:hypothetical protein n=1 Tax=Bacillus cereus TaxID=1396 RepID=UPI0013D0CE09|nr:hypothetical protein [Bacillus cereus]
MYRQLARKLKERNKGYETVFKYHPVELSGYLEEIWRYRKIDPYAEIITTQSLNELSDSIRNSLLSHSDQKLDPLSKYISKDVSFWHHLIYAYMIENTRIFEIFHRVLKEYLYGERLATPSAEGQRWLRITENLFYMDSSPFMIHRVTSEIRPQIRANRRNAYYRMFGLDLNHGTDKNEPFIYEKPAASNRNFVATFEEFLREVWIGIKNAKNSSGEKPTDDGTISNLAKRLANMLTERRQGGNLAREEFWYVATMSWFHLTVEFDSPIVKDLKAEATSPEERLRKIGERVKLPASSKSENYFQLAESMSIILLAIETGKFNGVNEVKLFYDEGSDLCDDMKIIISQWSQATGRDMKANRVTNSPGRDMKTNRVTNSPRS